MRQYNILPVDKRGGATHKHIHVYTSLAWWASIEPLRTALPTHPYSLPPPNFYFDATLPNTTVCPPGLHPAPMKCRLRVGQNQRSSRRYIAASITGVLDKKNISLGISGIRSTPTSDISSIFLLGDLDLWNQNRSIPDFVWSSSRRRGGICPICACSLYSTYM